MNKVLLALGVAAAFTSTAFAGAAPKRLLVVTNSIGFRHSSIELTEKVLRELAAKAGDFTIISTMDHPDYPDYANSGPFGSQVANGTPAQQTYIRKLNDRANSPLLPLQQAVTSARAGLAQASLTQRPGTPAFTAAIDALAAAELRLANAKADAFVALQRSDNRLTPEQVLVLRGEAQSPAAPRTAFAPQVGAATPLQQKAIAAANGSDAMIALVTATNAARTAMLEASLSGDKSVLAARSQALATAEQNLATARANEFARIQQTAGRFQPAVVKTMVSRFSLPETGNAATDGAVRVFADMLNVEALKNYDGVFFASTVGALPFPDLDGFIGWVNNGGAWLGNHAASDSMHGVTKYFDMMGGEFTGHGSQTSEVMVVESEHPIAKAIGSPTLTVYDEMYTFENANFDFSRVHTILGYNRALNDGMHSPVGAPGHWGSTWIKNAGRGRVFYTSLGHREDVIDPNYNVGTRMNPPEVAHAYQRMMSTGVRWALGLIAGDATPQIKVPTPAGGPGVTGGRGGGGGAPAAAPPGAPATGRGGA